MQEGSSKSKEENNTILPAASKKDPSSPRVSSQTSARKFLRKSPAQIPLAHERRHTAPPPVTRLPLDTTFSSQSIGTSSPRSARSARSSSLLERSLTNQRESSLALISPITTPRGQTSTAQQFSEDMRLFAHSQVQRLCLEDFFEKNFLGAKKALDDHLIALVERVKLDILLPANLKHEQSDSPRDRQKIQAANFKFYEECLSISLKSYDFHTSYAIFLALESPAICKLRSKTYELSLQGVMTSKKNKQGFLHLSSSKKKHYKEALKIFSQSHNFYQTALKNLDLSQVIPWMIPLYKRADATMMRLKLLEQELKIYQSLKKASDTQQLPSYIQANEASELLTKEISKKEGKIKEFEESFFSQITQHQIHHYDQAVLSRGRSNSLFFTLTPRQSYGTKPYRAQTLDSESLTERLKALTLAQRDSLLVQEREEAQEMQSADSSFEEISYSESDSNSGIIIEEKQAKPRRKKK